MTNRVTARTWTAGELVTESMLNEQIRDNGNAMFPYTAAGQIALSDASNNLTVLSAVSNANKKIVSNGTTWILQDDVHPMSCILNPANVSLVAGDNAGRFRTPASYDSYRISDVGLSRISGTGILTVQLRNVRTGNDILSTKVTIDSGETNSNSAAIPYVINTANDDVLAGDQIAIDVDIAGTSTLMAICQIGLVRY